MSSSPTVDDLELVLALRRTGSVGAAARELRVTQPSASARLGRLERRCGARLFDRDTRGSRPTAAGMEMARQAEHVLGHLAGVFDAAAAAAGRDAVAVGTFASLAGRLFPSLEELLEVTVRPVVDHGPELIDSVGEGALDAAVVAVADQVALPRTVAVHPLGLDDLVVLRTPEAPPVGSGRLPFAGQRLVYTTYDLGGHHLHERLEQLGASAQLGPTLATTVALARQRGAVAVVPRSVMAHDLRVGETVEDLPFRAELQLSLVTAREVPPALRALEPRLSAALHLWVSRAGAPARRRGPR